MNEMPTRRRALNAYRTAFGTGVNAAVLSTTMPVIHLTDPQPIEAIYTADDGKILCVKCNKSFKKQGIGRHIKACK